MKKSSNVNSENVVLMCAYFIAAVAAVVIIGWHFEIRVLKSVIPQFITMKVNTAVSFLLLSVSLGCFRTEVTSWWKKILGHTTATMVLMISVLTLTQYLYNVNLGIDEFLYPDPEGKSGAFPPGRLAPITAVCFSMLVFSIYTVNNRIKPFYTFSQILLFITFIVAFQALLNYFLGITNAFGFAFYTRMAVHTAALFIVACIGFFMSRSKHGLMAILTADTLGGRTARTLLGPAIIIPPGVHWLQTQGLRAGLYDENFSVLIKIVGNVSFFAILIWRNAAIIHRADLRRRESEAAKSISDQRLEQIRQEQLVAKATLNSEARLKAIFNSALGAIVTIDEKGCVLDWNNHACKMFGWTKEEILGKNIGHVIVPLEARESQQKGMNHYAATGEGPILNKMIEVVALRKTAERFPVQLSVVPVKLSDSTIFTAFIIDITERKKIEQVKNEFISVVSHELRTPLTSIRGALGLLSSGAMGEIPQKAMSLIEIACSNSERLSRLINDILDIEKIESGGMTFKNQTVNLQKFVEEVIQVHGSYAEKHQVYFKLVSKVPDIHVTADRDRLMQVFANLLSNAAKFSPQGENVEIGVKQLRQTVQIWVKDNGPGISEEFKKRIFGKFTQADSSDSRQKDGTGLGLNISRAIVEKLGGRIWFESEVGKGATFIFELPLTIAQDKASESVSSDAAARNILVFPEILHVEDDLDVARVVRGIVEGTCRVTTALDLFEAEQKLKTTKFDLVVLDLKLPDGSSLGLISTIKSLNPDCKIIIFSAYDITDTRLNQVDAVLIKTRTTNNQLLSQIRIVLGLEKIEKAA